MMTLGLTDSERVDYERTLRTSHVRSVDVDVLDLDGNVLSNIEPVLLSGQVTVDLDAETTRSATLTFLDPSHSLNFDTDSPDDGAVYADRMIRVRYGVAVPALGRTVWATVFVGPATKLSRQGDTVQVEAQGKEVLLRGAVWRAVTLKKGSRVTAAIRTLVAEIGGETSLNIPEVTNQAGRPVTMPRARSLDRNAEIWAVARSLARSVNRQLFYSGDGRLTLRPLPGRSVYTFRTGDSDLGTATGQADVLNEVSVSYELGDVRNTIEVKGQPPKGKKGRVRGVAVAPRAHVLSPWRLGRKDAPRYLVESIEDQSIRTDADARRRANDLLDDRLREVVDVSFDALPIPHLDPGDLVTVQTPDFTSTFRLRKFAIPLGADSGAVMPVGYLKRVTPTRSRSRSKRSKRV